MLRKKEPVTTTEPATDPTNATIATLSFDEALVQLQRAVADLESGGQTLEASIALYERGVALQARCERLLAEAELKVQQLMAQAGGALTARDVRPDDLTDEA